MNTDPLPSAGQSRHVPAGRDTLRTLRGSAKHLFRDISGDEFLRLEREGWDIPEQQEWTGPSSPEAVWQRIKAHEGETFHTVTGHPFVYKLDGNGWHPYRSGERVERRATYTELTRALALCPLKSTTQLKGIKVMAPSYWFGILTDDRIRCDEW